MQFSLLTFVTAITLSTQILASPTPYVKKIETATGAPKYVCVDSDLSCLTKRVEHAAAAAVGGFIGYAMEESTKPVEPVVTG